MKICHYNSHQAGVVVGDHVYPIGDALVKSGCLRSGYTMLEVIDALANHPAADAMRARRRARPGSLAPSFCQTAGADHQSRFCWAAAANYRAHQQEMRGGVGAVDRAAKSKDELMAEFFLKTTSSIIGPNDTIILPKIS